MWTVHIIILALSLSPCTAFKVFPNHAIMRKHHAVAPLLASTKGSTNEEAFDTWLQAQRYSASMNRNPSKNMIVLDAGEDVDSTFTFLGVAWQVLADISTNSLGEEDVEVVLNFPGLKNLGAVPCIAFADLYETTKTEAEKNSALIEMRRIRVEASPVAGPAFVITSRARSPDEKNAALDRRKHSLNVNEDSCLGAIRQFVDRVVVGVTPIKGNDKSGSTGACPFTASVDVAATGLSKQGVSAGPVAYRVEALSDGLDAIAAVSCFIRLSK